MRKLVVIVVTMVMMMAVAIPSEAKLVAKDKIGNYTISVYQGRYGTKVKWMGKTIHWYDFRGKVKIVPERKLTAKMLLSRKGKTLYIERIYGKVVNGKLDGKTSCGNYISYRSLKGKALKGNRVITYCVYSPYTHWTDDIDERYDVIL